MVNYFFSNIVKFQIINKLTYIHSTVFKSIKLKLVFYPTNLDNILKSIIFIRIFSNTYIRLELNVNNGFSDNLVSNSVKNKTCYSLFLLFIFKGLIFTNKLIIFLYYRVLQFKSLQKSCIFFSKFLVTYSNINRAELNAIINNQFN